MTDSSRSTCSRGRSWRWWIMVLLLGATAINYMDRVALASVSVRVTTELGLTEAQYGNLELAFGLAFAAGSLLFGVLADRWNVYLLYPAVLVAWSLAGMASGWAQGFGGLLVCRTLLGFFEAGHWPCALRTTFALLDEKERTLGNSILQSGASLGAVVTPQLMRWLMTDEPGSWRSAFVIVGSFGLVWIVAWFLLLRPRDLSRTQSSAKPALFEGVGAFVLGRSFWALALLITGAQTVWHIYRVWLMKFLQTGRGYSETAALNFNSLYFLASDVGCLLAGFVVIMLVRRRAMTPHAARRWVFIAAAMLTSLSVLIPFLGAGWLLLGTLLLISMGALALFPCFYSFVQELAPDHVGRLTGLLSMGVWAVTSPLHTLFGWLIDRTGSYDAGLMVAGVAPWIGVLAMRLLWDRDAAGRAAYGSRPA